MWLRLVEDAESFETVEDECTNVVVGVWKRKCVFE